MKREFSVFGDRSWAFVSPKEEVRDGFYEDFAENYRKPKTEN
jgi:hypothetical protein